VLRALSDSLFFRVLVVAKGFEPRFVARVDPAQSPIEARLLERDPAKLGDATTVRGRVVDPEGRPVVGATVSPFGSHRGMMRRYGSVEGADPLAVTDQDGAFFLATRDSGTLFFVEVHARGLAPRAFEDVPAGAAATVLALSRGGSLAGRILLDGRPLPGIAVAVAPADGFLWGFRSDTIATDAEGRYRFTSLPCNRDYALSATMESLRGYGATRAVAATVGDEDSTTVVPALIVEPGRRLAGRVLLSDGRPVPLGTRLLVAYRGDSRALPLDPEGRFEADGLPAAEVRLTVVVRGYHLSPRLPAAWPRRDNTIALAMIHDRDDLRIVLDPDAESAEPPARPGAGP
jgi:hypothetical protein